MQPHAELRHQGAQGRAHTQHRFRPVPASHQHTGQNKSLFTAAVPALHLLDESPQPTLPLSTLMSHTLQVAAQWLCL